MAPEPESTSPQLETNTFTNKEGQRCPWRRGSKDVNTDDLFLNWRRFRSVGNNLREKTSAVGLAAYFSGLLFAND